MPISISVPEDLDFKPRITVVGVGGGGCNAVDHMIESKLEGVSFVACNTDLQALRRSTCPVRVRLGLDSTQGLGAGSNPTVGREAAEESIDKVMDAIGDAHMLFIVAGFGGGTGTGAVPVIARAAHERRILTVAVVTTPFTFEAINRTEVAQAGLQELRKSVDTFVVIANQKLFDVQTDGMSLLDSFRLVDNVLYNGVRGITDLLMRPGLINLDFADVRSAMKDAGAALMGTGEAAGETRIEEATNAAVSNPLLSYQELEMGQAARLLVNITSSANVSLTQTERIMEIIRSRTHERVNLKVGVAIDDAMGDTIRVSVVMAGLDREHGSGLDTTPPRIPGHPSRLPKASRSEPLSVQEVSGRIPGYPSKSPRAPGSEPLSGREVPGRQGLLDIPGVFDPPTVHRDGVDARHRPVVAAGAGADLNGLAVAGLRAADARPDGRTSALAERRARVPHSELEAAAKGNGASHVAVEAAGRSGTEVRASDDRPQSAACSRTKPARRALGSIDSDAPVRESRPAREARGADTPERIGPDQDMGKRGPGSGSPPASNRMAGAAVGRDTAASPSNLRPAVYLGSEASEGPSSRAKLFGFIPGRRKAGKDRREPSL